MFLKNYSIVNHLNYKNMQKIFLKQKKKNVYKDNFNRQINRFFSNFVFQTNESYTINSFFLSILSKKKDFFPDFCNKKYKKNKNLHEKQNIFKSAFIIKEKQVTNKKPIKKESDHEIFNYHHSEVNEIISNIKFLEKENN